MSNPHEPHETEAAPACCCGHDDERPAKERSVLNPGAAGDAKTTLRVAGMDCADEVEAIERALGPLKGVREVQVNLMAGKVTLLHDRNTTAEHLIAAIAQTGMKASREGAQADADVEGSKRLRQISVAISGAFTGLGLLLQWMKFSPNLAANVVFGIAIVAGGWFIAPKALRAVKGLALDMNVLMTVAVVGAMLIGEFSEGAAVTFLFALSELLEAFSLARARKAVQALMQLTPETALLKEGSAFREVPVVDVAVGATIAVKSGFRVPLDGVVTLGESAINQAPITGESMPVEKKPGDAVFAGTINGSGSLEIQTTRAHTDTTIAKIIHLVEEAQSQKAPSQRFVDVFARYYTPSVMVAALLVMIIPPLLAGGAWETWFYRGLVLLVIACPCALVISTPVSVVSGLTAMARRGVLIKGGAVLEAIGKLRALAVDKTGTITEGKPRVTKVVTVNGTDVSEVLRIAAGIDSHSEHPLALAVVAYASEKNVTVERSLEYQSLSGRGAEGTIGQHRYFVGNHRFAHKLGVCTPEIEQRLAEIESEALSVVIVGHKPHADCKGEILGILAVGDTIRAHAAEALAAIHAAGVQKVVMLSGDNQRTADAIAKQAGIDEAHGDLLPNDKINRVKALTGEFKHVGMVGDGVNDAPAMAAASVGIAMGQAGTDTAIETADVALMQDDLSKVAEAIALGRRTVGIIQFNIAFALALKAIFLVLALLGHTSLWFAILADTGATLLVIANALRLLTPSSSRAGA